MSIPEELVNLINSQPDPRVLKRALAVKMTLQGFTHQEIMGAIQVCSGFISKWKQIYIENGIEALNLGYKGFKPYLSPEDRQAVIEWIQAQKHISLPDLESYLSETYSVVYVGGSSYYQLLHAAGLSWKKQQKAQPQRDEAAVEAKKKRSERSWRTGKQR